MSFASSSNLQFLSNLRIGLLNSWYILGQRMLPQQCLLCAAPDATRPVCSACYLHLPWLSTSRCPQCALPTFEGAICGACLAQPPRFDKITAAFAYAWPLAPLIHQYKYAGILALAPLLAHALAGQVDRNVDLVIPTPLDPERLRARGFNQALEIARVVSRLTAVPLAQNACRRVRAGTPQALLPWRERAGNIRGAFVCDQDLRGKRVAVIDDVMTTGATLNELARNLRRAGAVEIHGWVVARTLKRE